MSHKLRTHIFVTIFFILIGYSNVFALSVEEAYKAIPHQRTVFNFDQAKMPVQEREFLNEFLSLVDLAMVERVEMLTWLTTYGRSGKQATEYDEILKSFNKLVVPVKLKDIHSLVIEAIHEQRAFLDTWEKNGFDAKVNLRIHPMVKGANIKLMNAYNLLMKMYPNENEHNQQAFFDYLCALDFI